MSRREPPSVFAQPLVQILGIVGFLTGAFFFARGLLTGAIYPADVVASLPRWRDAVLDALVLAVVAGSAVLVAAGVWIVRRGYALARPRLVVWWRYRRCWVRMLSRHGLTDEDSGWVQAPRLRSVTVVGLSDVAVVRMLPGQSAGQWHEVSAALAEEPGADSARVRLGKRRADVEIVFIRDEKRKHSRKLLALSASQSHPLSSRLLVPQPEPRVGDRVALRVSGFRL